MCLQMFGNSKYKNYNSKSKRVKTYLPINIFELYLSISVKIKLSIIVSFMAQIKFHCS